MFIALRPSTFYNSKTSGALSGYQNTVLTIAPPPADEVLAKRIEFAVRVAEGKTGHVNFANIRLDIRSIVLFLQASLRSIRRNEQIRSFLSNISGGNVRSVVEMFTSFCGSPNVEARKIIEIEERSSDYEVPIHEFTKHALLGEYAYFNSNSSFVACNVFDVGSADPREHFLASLVISFLTSNHGMRDNDGFLSGQLVLNEMGAQGYMGDQVRFALRRLATKRLIETPHAHYRELEVDATIPAEEFYFRATSIGIYHLRHWTGAFNFLDAMSTDTPIFEQDSRKAVFEYASSFDIRDRYQKARAFREYLADQWDSANINVDYYDFLQLLHKEDPSFRSVRLAIEKLGGGVVRRGASWRSE